MSLTYRRSATTINCDELLLLYCAAEVLSIAILFLMYLHLLTNATIRRYNSTQATGGIALRQWSRRTVIKEPAMYDLDEATRLRQQGYRLTPQRLQVLQVLKTRGQHMTAEEIHAAIVPHQPYLDIATVYRTLQWLQGVGLAAPISLGEGKLHFEYRRPGEHHHHLICQHCGQHIQISDDHFAALKADLEQRYGFSLQVDHLALTGCCAGCRAAQSD
jgi:Fur family ferric uptake transcriptional regulator